MFSLRAKEQTSDSETVKNNRPFSSCPKPLFQSEAKCEVIVMKMIFYYHAIKIHFHDEGFALSVVLKVVT